MLVLSVVEYCQKRKELMQQKKYFKVQPKTLDRIGVSAGIDDFDVDDDDELHFNK